jgi:hypothetical protein
MQANGSVLDLLVQIVAFPNQVIACDFIPPNHSKRWKKSQENNVREETRSQPPENFIDRVKRVDISLHLKLVRLLSCCKLYGSFNWSRGWNKARVTLRRGNNSLWLMYLHSFHLGSIGSNRRIGSCGYSFGLGGHCLMHTVATRFHGKSLIVQSGMLSQNAK